MADKSACPDGLPWCTRHLGGDLAMHRSEYRDLPLRQRGREYGDAAACAVQLADYPGPDIAVSVRAGGPFWPDGTRSGGAFLDVPDAARAEVLARFLEWMAMATPARHRALAAQVRAAAVIAFGEEAMERSGD